MSGDNEWGWEPIDHEDEAFDDYKTSESSNDVSHAVQVKSYPSKNQSNDNFHARHSNNNLAFNLKKGITSSPSFAELDNAIGATLNSMTPSVSTDDLGGYTYGNSSPASHRLQHQHQRYKQKQQYQQFVHSPYINAPQVSQAELAPFITEVESRAVILFHSPNMSTATVRDACQKFGVLYYIRPEFHSRGVTLLCYFDLKAAIRAKTLIAENLAEIAAGSGNNNNGANAASSSCHYSIPLNTSDNTFEEFRLTVKGFPSSYSEDNIRDIFSEFGPLRSVDIISPSSTVEGENAVRSPTYIIEFFSMQDARLAESELREKSVQRWGAGVSIRFATLDDAKAALCRNLVALLRRWKSEQSSPYLPVAMQQQQQQQQHTLVAMAAGPMMAAAGAPLVTGTRSPALEGGGGGAMDGYAHPHGTLHHHPGGPMRPNDNAGAMLQPAFVPNQIMPMPLAVPMVYGYPTHAAQIFQQSNSPLTNPGGGGGGGGHSGVPGGAYMNGSSVSAHHMQSRGGGGGGGDYPGQRHNPFPQMLPPHQRGGGGGGYDVNSMQQRRGGDGGGMDGAAGYNHHPNGG